MPINDHIYSPETLAMLYRVLDECLRTIGADVAEDIQMSLRIRLAQVLLARVAAGETSPSTLKVIALNSVRDLRSPFRII